MSTLVAVVIAAFLICYNIFAAFVGIFSIEWWTGTYDIGIASDCHFDNKWGAQTYCGRFSMEALKDGAEQAMFGLLVVSIIAGFLALLVIVLGIILKCCGTCNVSVALASVLASLQGACMFATIITMGCHYSWSYPSGTTSIGGAFVMNIVAVPIAWLAVALLFVYYFRRNRQGADGKTLCTVDVFIGESIAGM